MTYEFSRPGLPVSLLEYRCSVCGRAYGYDLESEMMLCPTPLWIEGGVGVNGDGRASSKACGHAHVAGEDPSCLVHPNARVTAISAAGRGSRAAIVAAGNAAAKVILAGSSCAFGVFDGVHRGHAFLLDQAKRSAARNGGLSVALTFSVDPDEIFAADRLFKLMSNEERLGALAESGVDAVVVLPFDREFASLSPVEFLDAVFGDGAPRSVHVGEGFRFGCKGAGDANLLQSWGSPREMEAKVHDLLRVQDSPVSATRIRGLISQGRTEEASILLGRPCLKR